MSVTVMGATQLQARLDSLSASIRSGTLMHKAAAAAVAEQKLLTVPFRRTGNLGQSIRIVTESPASARIVAGVNYAGWVERGTGIYGPSHQKITPKTATVLSWMGGPASAFRLTGSVRKGKAGAGAMRIFARSVRGRPATPFFFSGARAGLQKAGLADVVVAAWNSAA